MDHMNELEPYSFLRACLEDCALVSAIASDRVGNPRHAVCLMHDALEFLLDEILQLRDKDIYKDGQNTIGLNAAINLCEKIGVDLPLIGTIRSIQKHRGDAKHHAQVPQEKSYRKMVAEFEIIITRLIYEHFGSALGESILKLPLLSYQEALYYCYRKHRTHKWDLALQFILAALLHKHRRLIGTADVYSGIPNESPEKMIAILEKEIAAAHYPRLPVRITDYVKGLGTELRTLLAVGVKEAAEFGGEAFSRIDELVPSYFKKEGAKYLTDHLVLAPVSGRVVMGWTKWAAEDTEKKKQLGDQLKELLASNKVLRDALGKPFYDDDGDRFWKWWELAAFDGVRWHTFHLNEDFYTSLESSGIVDEEEALRREKVMELVLEQFRKASSGG